MPCFPCVLMFITNTSRAYYLLFMIQITSCYKNKYPTIHMHITINNIILYCIILYYIVLYYILLYYIIYYIILHYLWYYIILYYIIFLKYISIWNGQRIPAAGQDTKRMDMIRAVIQAKLKDTAVWWNGIKICLTSANRFTCPTFFLHWSIFRFSYLVGKETLIIWFQRVLSQSQCGWLPHWTNISQLGQEEGMLSPEGKKIPTRGIGASRIKQQQAATHAMCMCIFCQNPS